MNRKTLVLPAVVGLLAPVLAACGGSDSGGSSGDAIVVGTTDRFTATKEAPAPLDPAYAYDVGTWNILRQTVQTLMVQPSGDGDPVPEAAESCGFTDSGNERYACTLRKGLKFSNGDPITATDVKFSIDRALRHQGRQRRVRPAVHHRHRRDPGRPRGHLPPQDRRRDLPVQAVHPGRRHRQPRRLRQGQAARRLRRRRLRPVHPRDRGQGRRDRQGRLHQEPQLQGAVEGRTTTRSRCAPSRTPTPWARPSTRATST